MRQIWVNITKYCSRIRIEPTTRGSDGKSYCDVENGERQQTNILPTNPTPTFRDWPDTHCGAIYCTLGVPTASLLSLARLAAGRPRLL